MIEELVVDFLNRMKEQPDSPDANELLDGWECPVEIEDALIPISMFAGYLAGRYSADNYPEMEDRQIDFNRVRELMEK